MIDRAVETSQPLTTARGHAVTVTLPTEPLMLCEDPVRLAQVFANLLNNATKVSETGENLANRGQKEDRDVTVRMRDTGMGITQMLLKVFDLFTQAASRSLTRSQGGLGIGLSLVQSLVKMHGGTVTAFSEGVPVMAVNSSSSFRFRTDPLCKRSKASLPTVSRQSCHCACWWWTTTRMQPGSWRCCFAPKGATPRHGGR